MPAIFRKMLGKSARTQPAAHTWQQYLVSDR